MASMVIRNIPDDVMERFKARAKAAGKSAEQLAREAIVEKGKSSREEAWARIDALRAQTKRIDDVDLVEEIRREREERTNRILGNEPGSDR
ncbi:MAG: hypothetical protein ABIK36_02040 [Pseudomonadota bacterium]|jgi:plasmid stability protein